MIIEKHKLKSYFWSLFGIIGVVFFWAGVWDGLGNLYLLVNPLVSFLVGLAMLTFSGLIFKQFNPFKEKKKTPHSVLHKVKNHPKKKEFKIIFYDLIKGKDISINADKLKGIEKEAYLVLEEKGKEFFIPLHRVTKITHKNKTHWKA